MSGWKKYPLVFIAALGWFSIFQSWSGFVDPDAFYHAKMASLMWQFGPLHAFPWLDLTTLGRQFADQHFLFHVALMPFVRWFGMLPGTDLASVLFAAAFALVFYIVLERWPVAHPWVWTVLALITEPLIFRLLLGKASPFALAWFVLGLFAMARKRPMLAFIVGAGFALSHGGWIIVLGAQALFVLGEALFAVFVQDRPWKTCLDPRGIGTGFATLAGVLVGMVVHPNFPADFSFLWVQVVKIGVGTPFGRVFMGEEWLPSNFHDFFTSQAALYIIACMLVYGLLAARRKDVDLAAARQAVGLGLVTAGLVALTIKSQRFIEYLVPAFTLWLAVLASFVDAQTLFVKLRAALQEVSRGRRWLWGLLVAVVVAGMLRGPIGAFVDMHANQKPFDLYAKPMAAISAVAHPGDRVFHSSWDFFPELFVQNDQLKYVVGMDPTFLLDANPRLSDAYTDLTIGRVTSTAYAVIHDDFHAKFVLLVKQDHKPFADALAADPRFVRLYDDDTASAYRVTDENSYPPPAR